MSRARAIVALDVPGAAEAVALADRLGEACDFVKVGSELFTAAGPDVIAAVTSPPRKASLGSWKFWNWPRISSIFSKSKKKKVLSLMIGPPMVPP